MSAPDEPLAAARHSHEPAIPVALDAEGRCLVCRLLVALRPFAAKWEYWKRADEGTMMHSEHVSVDMADLERAATAVASVTEAPHAPA